MHRSDKTSKLLGQRAIRRCGLFLSTVSVALSQLISEAVVARPISGAFSLEFFHRKNSFLLEGEGPYLLESDHIGLRHDEGYSGAVNGWVTLRYIAGKSVNYSSANLFDLTGGGVEIGLSRAWNIGEQWQLAAESDYQFESINSVSDSGAVRIGWHSATAQIKMHTKISKRLTINTAVLGRAIDGFLKQRNAEPLSIRIDDYLGSSLGVAWEIEPTGIVTVTAIHFTETSIGLRFIRTYDMR